MKASSCFLSIAIWLAVATASSALELKAGVAFPLSGGAKPTLISIEVHRITSDESIDVAVSLKPPAKVPSGTEMLVQVGEFCLRYQEAIVGAAVPREERQRMNVFVPLYRLPVPGQPGQFREGGFAFRVVDGKCSLAAPFPPALRSEAQARAKQPVGTR